MIDASVKIIHDIIKDLDKEDLRTRKALAFAVSRTAFETQGDMQFALKRGWLGLAALQPLRRRSKGIRQRTGRAPLANLSKGITYRKIAGGGEGLTKTNATTFEIGFLGGGSYRASGLAKPSAAALKSGRYVGEGRRQRQAGRQQDTLRALAILHMEGYRIPLDDKALRREKASMGIYLKKDTAEAVVPSRSIIDNYMMKYGRIIPAKIESVFIRKMRGERV